MKLFIKYLLLLFAITVSCTSDEIAQLPSNGESVTINFEITVEDGQQSRTISDGKSVDKLYYAIFSEDDQLIIPKKTKQSASGITSTNGYSMSITLPYGPNYKAVFWAQNSETEAYTISNNMVVDVNYNMACNDENRDAFYGVFDICGNSNNNVKVTLQRPFAQLNVGAFTFDWEYVKKYQDFNVTKSSILVRDIAHRIDLLTGELSERGSASFKPGSIPAENLKVDIDDNKTLEEFTYLAMAYLLADTDPTTHSAEIFFLDDSNRVIMFEDETSTNVELQRNYQTNYIGQVLSNYGKVNIHQFDYDGNTEDGNVYYNVSEPTTIENTVYNMSDHNTALQFASVSGQEITYNNLLFTGDIWTIELGEYRGSSYVKYKNTLNNVELRNLSVSACIECHEWYFSPATIAYGKSEFNNCKMKGATTIRTTMTDKHGVVHRVIPVDIGVRNESEAVFNGGEYGSMFAWTHAIVTLNNVTIDTLYCGTCDSTKHSWMTIGSGTKIDKVICCEPRCPYGTLEYSTTMTIKSGAKVGSLQLVSTDVEFLIIEDGAEVGQITCEGVEYTYQELRAAMGL